MTILNKIGLDFFRSQKTPIPVFAHQYLQVYSHPRSGTHLLETFIAINFYKEEDLSLKNLEWGHWANRRKIQKGNPFGKLFGGHFFPGKQFNAIDYPSIYIYRDGRAVAYSIWKTENFIHPKHAGISFSEFLRKKIDWIGSPAFRCKEKMTIATHWSKHVDGWIKLAKSNQNILVIRFEDIVNDPERVFQKIRNKFFIDNLSESVKRVNQKVGLLPNQAKIDYWKTEFSDSDNQFFINQVNPNYLHLESSAHH